jgi:hypothetical protein
MGKNLVSGIYKIVYIFEKKMRSKCLFCCSVWLVHANTESGVFFPQQNYCGVIMLERENNFSCLPPPLKIVLLLLGAVRPGCNNIIFCSLLLAAALLLVCSKTAGTLILQAMQT